MNRPLDTVAGQAFWLCAAGVAFAYGAGVLAGVLDSQRAVGDEPQSTYSIASCVTIALIVVPMIVAAVAYEQKQFRQRQETKLDGFFTRVSAAPINPC
jgi:hypothetical protein